MENVVDLELAKRLKAEGYKKPCTYFWQDKDLPYSPRGLKWCKNGKKLNHNRFDDFIYSAPTVREAMDYLLGKNIKYASTTVINLGKNKSNGE